MRGFVDKMKVVYFPYLLIGVGYIAAYSFLNWLFILKTELISIDEMIVQFLAPFVLIWIPVLLWLRPRLRTLKLDSKRADPRGFYLAMAAFTIVPAALVAQAYLATATGKLAHVDRAEQLATTEHTKYFMIDSVFVDRENAGGYAMSSVRGRHNEDLDLEIFFASPIKDADLSSAFGGGAWYGVQYRKTIKNRLSDARKEELYNMFADSASRDFDSRDLSAFTYLEKVGNSDDHRGYESAIRNSSSYTPGVEAVILKPHEGSFDARNGKKLQWMFGLYGAGAFIWFVMLLFPKVDEKEMKRVKAGMPSKHKSEGNSFDMIIPKPYYYVTPSILGINIFVFVAMTVSGLGFMTFRPQDLLAWGACYGPSVHGTGLIRLLTSMFLHAGLWHLAVNMLGLLFVGIILEPILSPKKYLVLYLAAGIAGSLASIQFHEAAVSVGASGAIFGLYGALLVVMLRNNLSFKIFKHPLVRIPLFFVALNLFLGVATPGIDNAAHIGGLVGGIAVALLLKPDGPIELGPIGQPPAKPENPGVG